MNATAAAVVVDSADLVEVLTDIAVIIEVTVATIEVSANSIAGAEATNPVCDLWTSVMEQDPEIGELPESRFKFYIFVYPLNKSNTKLF